MLTPLRDLGPAGTAGAGRRVGPPACGPHGARSRGGRSPRARPRSACGGATGLPRPPRRPASAVQISERLRTPERPRAAGPSGRRACRRATLPSWAPGLRRGWSSFPALSATPFGVLILTVGAPTPARHRIAWRGTAGHRPGLETLRANVGRPLWLLGKGGGPAWGGPGPARSD